MVEIKKIGDVCDFVGGSQPPKSTFKYEQEEDYVRLIQTRDYKTNNFLTYIHKDSTTKFCDESDIMIGRYGPPIFQILRGLKGAYNVALMKAIPNEQILRDYLYYFLIQDSLFEYIDGLSLRTGGQTGVDVPMLKKYPIRLPDKPYQEKVIQVLGSLDEKVKLNNEINEKLLEMSTLTFRYWFYQFQFPREGSSSNEIEPLKTVYDEILGRDIPIGWESLTLGDIADIRAESVDPSLYPDKSFAYFSIPKFDKYQTFQIETGGEIRSNKYVVYENDILVSKLNPRFNRVIYPVDNPNMICSTEFVVWRAKDPLFREFLFQVAQSEHFIKYCSINATGTSNSHKRINPTVMMKYNLGFDKEVVCKFGALVKPWHEMVAKNIQENVKLNELRNWLLPMLMNGQVKVNN